MWAHITCNVHRDWRSVPCQLHAKTNTWFCKFVVRWKRSYKRSAFAFCLQLRFGANGIASEKEQSNLILLYSVADNLYGTQELHCRRVLNYSDVPLAQTGSHILPHRKLVVVPILWKHGFFQGFNWVFSVNSPEWENDTKTMNGTQYSHWFPLHGNFMSKQFP